VELKNINYLIILVWHTNVMILTNFLSLEVSANLLLNGLRDQYLLSVI